MLHTSSLSSLAGHDHKGHPYTSYYQYGLSILALCLHQKRVPDYVVGKLLYAVEHDQLFQQGHFSVGECGQVLLSPTGPPHSAPSLS